MARVKTKEKNKNRLYYFGEGETEGALIHALKQNAYLSSGTFKKFNLWQNPIKKLIRALNKKSILIFIIDTDVTGSWDIFKNNITDLNGYNFCIFIQNKNLEDELVHCCSKKNITELMSDFYDVNSLTEFKSEFSRDHQLASRLKVQNFDKDNLWQRGEGFYHLCQQENLSLPFCEHSNTFLPQDTA